MSQLSGAEWNSVEEFTQYVFPKTSPANMKPDSVAILRNAAKSAKEIFEERLRLDADGKVDKPLFVLLGEYHNRASHQLHHLMVMHLLKKSGVRNLAFGLEMPSHFFSAHIGNCPLTNKALNLYLHQNNIPAIFIDSKTHLGLSGVHLDMMTEFNIKAAERANYNINQKYSPVDREGMHIRNMHMADMGQELATKAKANIVLIQTGEAHITGRDFYKEDFVFKESLTAELHRNHQSVFAVIPNIKTPLSYRRFMQELSIPFHEAQGLPLNKYIPAQCNESKALQWIANLYANRKNGRSVVFDQATKRAEYRFIRPILKDFGLENLLDEVDKKANTTIYQNFPS